MSSKRLAVVALGVLGSLLFIASPALAHAELLSSDPAPGAVVDAAPKNITLVFSEPIEISLGAIRVFDGTGAEVSVGPSHHPGGHTEQVQVSVGALAGGSYVVDWRVVSADSHPVHAAYTFQVGATSTLGSGILDGILNSNHSNSSAAVGLGISRGLVALTVAVVFGALAATALGIVSLGRRLRRLVLASSIVGALAAIIALPLEVAYATGRSLTVVTDGSAWSAVLDSRIGVAWSVRAALIAVVGVGLTLTAPKRSTVWWRLVLGGGLIAVGISAAFGGHGATGRWQVLGVVATVAHVGGMAVWLGGLTAVLVSFGDLDDEAVRRYSKVALLSISVVVVSGALQALRQLGSFDALTHTDYGALLVKKLVAVAVLVVIAAVSRQATLGRVLGRGPARKRGSAPSIDRPRLVRAVVIEAVIAAVILVITSLLMAANPAIGNGPKPFSATLDSQNYLAAVVVSPAGVGSNDLHLYISSPTSSTDIPDSVQVEISDPSRSVDPITIAVTLAGAGHYTTSAAVFPYPAQWKLHISAIYHQFDKVQWDTLVPIR
jgi:copper transport protein